jgi:AcrR family transcriptional regulator
MTTDAARPDANESATRVAAGRPRDPHLERRAMAAARELYIEAGRTGVTFNAVANRSNVGKPALYRRWRSSDDLIIDALSEIALPIVVPDRGDALAELAEFAESLMHTLLSPEGAALLRLNIDFHNEPELYSRFMTGVDTEVINGAHAIVVRAVGRGELPDKASPEVIAAAVAGGAMVEVLTRLRAGDTEHDDDIRRFAVALAGLAVGRGWGTSD